MADTHNDGWFADPWQRWPERYYEGGQPTDRVRYGITEGRDPVPAHMPGTDQAPPSSPPPPPGYPPYESPPGAPPYGYAPPGYPPYGGQPGYGYGYGYYPPQPKTGTARTGPLPLHPMDLGDILDGAFRLYRANFKTIVVIVSVIAAPIQLASALARRNELGGVSLFSNFSNPTVAQNNNGTSFTSAVAILVTAVLGLIALPYAAGAISRVVAASYLGGEEAPGPALKASLRRALPSWSHRSSCTSSRSSVSCC